MRRLLLGIQIGIPTLTLGVLGGCIGPATNRQFSDFAVSTGVRVIVQSITSLIEAAILQGA